MLILRTAVMVVAGTCCLLMGCAASSTSNSTGTTLTAKATVNSPQSSTSSPSPDSGLSNSDSVQVVDEMPAFLYGPRPHYPEIAKRKKVEGSVWVKVLVGKDGRVHKAVVSKPSNTGVGFEDAALQAARQGTWNPATLKSKYVDAWVTYEIKFEL